MRTSLFVAAVALTLIACGEAKAQSMPPTSKALNQNPLLDTVAKQIEQAKITGSCGESSYLAGINSDGSLICKAFTQQGFTVTVVSQPFAATSISVPGVTPPNAEPTAACPVGEKATGGGVSLVYGSFLGSVPLTDGTGWKAIVKPANAGVSGTVYVVCLK